ncbi:MAG: hypothetical protein H6Q10_1583, partial [Acidobacteria bacterium]|nr:hypothetical protein [Acidobacteriota bacterium]
MTSVQGSETAPVPAAPSPPTPKPGSAGASALSLLVALLLLDTAVETFLAGSPLRWAVLGVAAVALAALGLLWKRLGPATRLVVPLLALAGLVTWATIRVGSWADPALRMLTFGLPRIALALAVLAIAASVALLFGLRTVRRAWYLGALAVLVALFALVPLVRGLLAGSPLAQVMAGSLDWQRVPAWLQGGYVSTNVVLPIGMLAGLGLLATALGKRARAAWAMAGLLIVAGAFLVQSAELTRAGRPNVGGGVAAPALARFSIVAPPDAGPIAPGGGQTAVEGGAVAAPDGSAPALPAAGAAEQAPQAPVVPVRAGAVTVAAPGQPVANKAIELRVTSHRSAASIGNQAADAGREFVIVDTAWKNLVPKKAVNRKKATDRTAGVGGIGFGAGGGAPSAAEDAANTTIESVRFEARPLSNMVWLVVDGRAAEPIDDRATRMLEGHLGPEAVSIPDFEQVVSGGLTFRAPTGARALSLLFLDSINGHLLVPITGDPPVLAASLG